MGVTELRRATNAGASAQAVHDRRYRRWRRRTAWVPLVGLLPLVLVEGAVAIAFPAHGSFAIGLGVGCGVAIVAFTGLLSPEHIDRWRRGAEGERRTARGLRQLERAGWTVVHDRADGRGNFDHIVVAPSGQVFLLDSKSYGGILNISGGRICVRWRDDPEDGWELDLGRHLRGAAAGLSRALAEQGLERHWITPVAVIWGDWKGGPIRNGAVAFVPGPRIAERLKANCGHPNAAAHDRAAAAVRALPAAG